MTPDLIAFAIRSLLRLGHSGKSALAQYARDKAAVFPDLKRPEPNLAVFVTGFFANPKRAHYVAADTGPYAEFWTENGADLANPRAVDSLYIALVKIRAEERVDLARAVSADSDATAGLVMIEQWADANEPVGPLARVLVTIADVALEYVASDPSVAGIDGQGEKLLAAFAKSLSDSLPDDGDFGPKDRFAERLFAVALRAGLETVSTSTAEMIDEEHVRHLLDRSLPPVIDSLPEDLSEQLDFRRALDAISGPALSAAMATIAEYPAAFLGDDFDATSAIGAVTQAVLLQASETGFDDLFTRGGLDQVYSAALGVAARRPELFVRDDGSDENDIARQLVARFATVLRDDIANDGIRVGAELGAAVLGVIGDNVHLYFDDADNWDSLAADLLESILGELESAVASGGPGALRRAFAREQVVELGRIVLGQIASTPSMISAGNAEVTRLVGIVARLIAADEDLLLTSDDWLAIAAVILDEAAANPGRLFDISDANGTPAAERLIGVLLGTAAENLTTAGRVNGAVLFGETLREAIVILVVAAAGNAGAAAESIDAIRDLAARLAEFVSEHRARFGSREWLALFDELLASVLGGEPRPDITIAVAESILEGGTA